jgi:hypothetical protein
MNPDNRQLSRSEDMKVAAAVSLHRRRCLQRQGCCGKTLSVHVSDAPTTARIGKLNPAEVCSMELDPSFISDQVRSPLRLR